MKNNLFSGLILGFVFYLTLAVNSIKTEMVTVKQSVPKETKCVYGSGVDNTYAWVKYYTNRGYDVTLIGMGTTSSYIIAKKY